MALRMTGCQNAEACVDGQIDCWSPGGPCPAPNDPACDLCGECLDCAATTYAPPDTTALMVACNTWAQVADREATKARQARNRLIRDLYAGGWSARSLAGMLDGVSTRYVYRVLKGDE